LPPPGLAVGFLYTWARALRGGKCRNRHLRDIPTRSLNRQDSVQPMARLSASHASQRRRWRRYRSLANHFCGRLPSHAQPRFAQRKRNTGRTQLSSRSRSRRWTRTRSMLPQRGHRTPSTCSSGRGLSVGGFRGSGFANVNTSSHRPPTGRGQPQSPHGQRAPDHYRGRWHHPQGAKARFRRRGSAALPPPGVPQYARNCPNTLQMPSDLKSHAPESSNNALFYKHIYYLAGHLL
jgi:hypothetical protein